MNLFLDVVSIPSQDPRVYAEIAAAAKPDSRMTKADTIAEWENTKKPAAVEAEYRKTAIDGLAGHVVSLSYAIDNGEVCWVGPGRLDRNWTAVPLAADDTWKPDYETWLGIERERIEMSFSNIKEKLGTATRPCVVTHCGRRFDIRFLWQRCVALNIKPPEWLLGAFHAGRDRRYDHFDTAEFVGSTRPDKTMFGPSLDAVCRAFGIAGNEVHGRQVYDLWLAAENEKIVKYNVTEVERLREVYRRVNFYPPAAKATEAA